jgi:hypothetical protein
VFDQNCDNFPTSITIVPHASAEAAWFQDTNSYTAGKYDLLDFFTGGSRCGYKVGQSGSFVADTTPTYTELLGGTLDTKATLGTLFVVDASGDCSNLNAVRADCSG